MLLWVCKKYNSCVKMPSIRSQVFDLINNLPDISLKDIKIEFRDCPSNTIGGYYREYWRIRNNTRKDTLDIRTELTKIIKDYKQPASARVQAIREYNNIVEATPESVEDPLLKLLQTLENDS